ncbi:MAG: TRAP transporter permease [Planctomycetota bacterium]
MTAESDNNKRMYLLNAVAVALSVFVLIEVNYPLLQPQSRLALFALLGLCFLYLHVPAIKRFSSNKIMRMFDCLLAAVTVLCFCYVIVQTEPLFKRFWIAGVALGDRAGMEATTDYVVGFVGLVLVLEAARRVIGITLPILALLFLLYARLGQNMPDWLFPHRGYDWSRIVSQAFLHSQGVFGIALKVMFTYVFPFVLFGAFLEVTGATGFVIDFSRRLFRNSTGGPAKVAVLSSGMMGSLSGSAVANTATTGTFTIPMMKSSGFKPELAAGVEAAASSGGALMPPIMGAGAYMMLEVITPSVTYLQIIKAALIPAILYYSALMLVVHLHSRKIRIANQQAIPEATVRLSVWQGLLFLLAIIGLIVFLVLGYTPFRAVSLSLVIILLMAPWSRDTSINLSTTVVTLVRTARAGIPLIAAASCVGIILGVVTLTGIGTKLPSAILPLAQDNLFAALFLLMISTIILGLGLPSAVCYLLMATLVGPVLTKLGVEPLAAHLFIFYFGMMSMVTPPVALAAYTAAAIAQANIMRSSFSAFRLSLVGFILPYAFVLNPAILLLTPDSDNVVMQVIISLGWIVAGIVFLAIASAGFCFARVQWISRILLFMASFLVIFLPDHDIIRLGIKLGVLVICGTIIYLNSLHAVKHKTELTQVTR